MDSSIFILDLDNISLILVDISSNFSSLIYSGGSVEPNNIYSVSPLTNITAYLSYLVQINYKLKSTRKIKGMLLAPLLITDFTEYLQYPFMLSSLSSLSSLLYFSSFLELELVLLILAG